RHARYVDPSFEVIAEALGWVAAHIVRWHVIERQCERLPHVCGGRQRGRVWIAAEATGDRGGRRRPERNSHRVHGELPIAFAERSRGDCIPCGGVSVATHKVVLEDGLGTLWIGPIPVWHSDVLVRDVTQGVLKEECKLAVPRQEHRATVGHGHGLAHGRIAIEHAAVPADELIVVAEARVVWRGDALRCLAGLDDLLAFLLGESFHVLADARRARLAAAIRLLGHGRAALAHWGAGEPQGRQESRERQERAAVARQPALLCSDLS